MGQQTDGRTQPHVATKTSGKTMIKIYLVVSQKSVLALLYFIFVYLCGQSLCISEEQHNQIHLYTKWDMFATKTMGLSCSITHS